MSCALCRAEVSGCKPYCIDHIDRLPYVKRILDQLSDASITINNIHAQEILFFLGERGPLTPNKLALLVKVNRYVIRKFIDVLVDSGDVEFVGLGRNKIRHAVLKEKA